MKVWTGCLAWLAFVAVAAIIIALTGCAPEPDPVSPWGLDAAGHWARPIPKPISCGRGCERWDEPGLMVQKREGE